MCFDVGQEFIEEMLEGEIPSEADLVSDEKGRRVVQVGDFFYKVVSNQNLDFLEEMHATLDGSNRVPETNIKSYRDRNKLFIAQEGIAAEVENAIDENGLSAVVEEVSNLWESFIDSGYVPKELDPKDLRFNQGQAVLIDYLDQKSVARFGDQKMNPTAKIAFNRFADGTAKIMSEKDEQTDYESTYQDIADELREASDYVGVEGIGKVDLDRATYYTGP